MFHTNAIQNKKKKKRIMCTLYIGAHTQTCVHRVIVTSINTLTFIQNSKNEIVKFAFASMFCCQLHAQHVYNQFRSHTHFLGFVMHVESRRSIYAFHRNLRCVVWFHEIKLSTTLIQQRRREKIKLNNRERRKKKMTPYVMKVRVLIWTSKKQEKWPSIEFQCMRRVRNFQ